MNAQSNEETMKHIRTQIIVYTTTYTYIPTQSTQVHTYIRITTYINTIIHKKSNKYSRIEAHTDNTHKSTHTYTNINIPINAHSNNDRIKQTNLNPKNKTHAYRFIHTEIKRK